MGYEVGAILEGKVTGITKFGVFVALPNGQSGMVHISEVAPTFVKEIRDFVTENQEVRVKVLSIDSTGKIGLSMKKAVEQTVERRKGAVPVEYDWKNKKDDNLSFEEKMNKFKHDSDEKMLALKRYVENKRGTINKKTNDAKHI